MKDRSYANRGKSLEDMINFANRRYDCKEIAMVQKVPTEFIPLRNARGQVYSVKVEHKSTVDYLGRYKGYPLAMEAKKTASGAIRFDAVQPHQAEFLDKFTKEAGTIGIVLVCFDFQRFFAVPWTFWGAAYETRVRRDDRTSNLTVSAFGEVWIVPKKKSVRIEELNVSWEISGFDATYGLNYLENIEKYIILE